MRNNRYYAMGEDELFTKFRSSLSGLSLREVTKRINKYGYNELPTNKRRSILEIFIGGLIDSIVLLLIVAIIASFLVGEYLDGFAIMFIVLVDLILGTIQEKKASNTAESLSNLIKEKVKVIRNGKESFIDATEVTIGDIVLFTSGDKVSADTRILSSHNFTIDESTLTGESLPVEKNSSVLKNKNISINEQTNMLFAGTSVVTGRATGIVVNIGLSTEIGKIANTINETKEEKSPLTIRVEKFSKQMSILIIIIAIIIAILLFIKGFSLNEILLSVIALSVSAMPEGLPLALTMALTIASRNMAKNKVVVKKLHSVESLGSCTVIASDKTGTLTVNEQTAKKILLPNNNEYIISGTGYNTSGEIIGSNLKLAKEVAILGQINNEAEFSDGKLLGDSIDLAFLVLGKKAKININDIEIIDSIPYESASKYSAVFYKKNNETYCTIKGPLEVVESFCNSINLVKTFDKQRLEKQNEYLAGDGYRVIALANGRIDEKKSYSEKDIKDLAFMGMVGFIDPIRKEAPAAIKKCRRAGIKVLMITGDHPLTAYKIAKDLKLVSDYSSVTTGDEVDKYLKKSEKDFDKFVMSKIIYTRVTPLQKLKIIESLKRQGEFVAVTGDGVNDAPALKAANIGIAMGSGTDIAKETANMIVMDDNFTSIVEGVEDGRVAYANIRKIIYFLISCGLAEVLFFLLSVLFNMPVPLVAIQLLWLNVVTDGLQDFALSFEKAEKGIMKEKPISPQTSLFDKDLTEEILISGISIGLIVFGLWFYLIKIINMNVSIARGYIVALMIIIQNIHAINCRSERNSALTIPVESNTTFIFSIIFSVIIGIAISEIDFLNSFLKTSYIPYNQLLLLFCLGMIIFVIMELYKEIKFHNK